MVPSQARQRNAFWVRAAGSRPGWAGQLDGRPIIYQWFPIDFIYEFTLLYITSILYLYTIQYESDHLPKSLSILYAK